MNVVTTIRKSLATAAILTVTAVPSWASPVEITILPSGTFGGFGYSVIHTAANESGGHPGYYTGGTIFYDSIQGNLFGDLDQDGLGNWNLLNISGTLLANIVGGGGFSNFSITSGALIEQTNGLVDGYLSYTLSSGPGSGSGTFYFDAIDFMSTSGGPNRLNSSSFILWGNNWDHEGGAPKPTSGGLGIDLKATMQPVPEPGTLLLLGSGLAGIMAWRRGPKTD